MAIALKALLGVYLKSAPHLVLIFCVYDDSMLAVVMPHTVTSTNPNLNSEYVIINCKKPVLDTALSLLLLVVDWQARCYLQERICRQFLEL